MDDRESAVHVVVGQSDIERDQLDCQRLGCHEKVLRVGQGRRDIYIIAVISLFLCESFLFLAEMSHVTVNSDRVVLL